MKSLSLATIVLACNAFLSPAIHALSPQDQAETPPANAASSPNAVVDMLGTKLSLSDDQKIKITPIIVDRQQQLKALQSDTSARPMQRARKAKEIFSDSDKKINPILTPDQQQKYAQIEKDMRGQMKQRMKDKQSNSSE